MVHYYVAALEGFGRTVFSPGEEVFGAGGVIGWAEGWGHGAAVDGGYFEDMVVDVDCDGQDPEGAGAEEAGLVWETGGYVADGSREGHWSF